MQNLSPLVILPSACVCGGNEPRQPTRHRSKAHGQRCAVVVVLKLLVELIPLLKLPCEQHKLARGGRYFLR
jgi:hypothetical protein